MPPVRALVALNDMGLHQVVEDILEITFREVKTDRVMTPQSLRDYVQERGDEYDLMLLDAAFGQEGEESPLGSLISEAPQICSRLVLIVPKSRKQSLPASLQNFPKVSYPFMLDDFTATVQQVREQVRTARRSAQDSAQ